MKYEYNGQVDLSRIAHCQTKSIFDVDIFHGDRADLSTACQDVLWSMEMVDSLRDVSDVSLDERNLLAACYNAYLATMGWEIASDELLPYEDKLGLSYKIKAQLERSEDVVEDALLGKVFAHARMVDASIEMQARLYDNLRNAKLFGYKFENDEIVDVLRADENGYEAFGGKEWAKRRKMIICTDEKASLDTWKDGLQIPNVMVMDAQDIHDYNDAMSEELKLKFETNHPQNGVTYVQHPMRQNVYIDLKLFHASMLEQKYNELRYFLISLGATEVICEVESNSSSDEKLRRRNSGKAGVDTLVGGGQVDFDRSIASSKTIDIKKRLASKFVGPGGKPHIPEKMLFYPFEDSWQHLAKMVMEGRVREYDVRLTYSKDFALTGQTLTSVGAKVRSKVPGYQFGVEGSFSAEFDNELKQLQSTAWHYYAKFGNGDNETGRGQAQSAQSSDAVAVHKEETADTADSSKKWDKALSIGETIISIAKRMREGQIK